ncbi:ORC1-type DNA replication protein [Candidatus Woesearchaeota archaeon]|nr:ORC1-type DNA replication protein [Candidatus Woesearchaeota archaeon]
MVKLKLSDKLREFVKQDSVFKDKKSMQASYIPDEIEHRDEQINQIAEILSPALKSEKPSNVFIYGKTGTGKTLSVKYTADEILSVSKEAGASVKVIYINCKLKKVADTEYRLIAEIAREFGKVIPPTGLPTDEVYKIFFKALEDAHVVLMLILDEIDQLVKKVGDGILYNLTRINSELSNSQISIIGISNDLMFANHLDPRVKSSLTEEELIFPPYNAIQIQDILKKRSDLAFKENVVDAGVIPKCSAYVARDYGDARRAIDLLRVAGELAERSKSPKVTLDHLDEAENKIEKDRVVDVVKTQPKQHQATLFSIFSLLQDESHKKKGVFTGDVYSVYKDLCSKVGLRPITQRRLSDIVGELDMLGLINAKVISKGRHGRTREIHMGVPTHLIDKIYSMLSKELDITIADLD